MYLELAWVLSPEAVAQVLTAVAAVDLAPGPGGSRITPLEGPVGDRVRQHMGGLGERWRHAALIALYPSAQLVAHRDPPIPGIRLHVPLLVNPDCWVFHAGVWQQLWVGHAYQMDPTELHGAVNWGTTRRVHLMLDT